MYRLGIISHAPFLKQTPPSPHTTARTRAPAGHPRAPASHAPPGGPRASRTSCALGPSVVWCIGPGPGGYGRSAIRCDFPASRYIHCVFVAPCGLHVLAFTHTIHPTTIAQYREEELYCGGGAWAESIEPSGQPKASHHHTTAVVRRTTQHHPGADASREGASMHPPLHRPHPNCKEVSTPT